MPFRSIVTKQLGTFLGALSHPHRLRIVEELGDQERDVNALTEALGITHSGVSQHLAVLRAHGVVVERREGRHVFYRLRRADLSSWLVAGLDFIGPAREEIREMESALRKARSTWGSKRRS